MKNPYRLLTETFKLSLRGKETKLACKERKTESYEISGFGKGISRG